MSHQGGNNSKNYANKNVGGDKSSGKSSGGSDRGSNSGAGGNVEAIRRLTLGHKPKQSSTSSISSLQTRASGSSYEGDRSNTATSGTGSEILSAPGGDVSQWIPDVPSGDGVRTPVSNNGRTLDEMNDAEIDTLFHKELAKMPPIAIAQVPKEERIPRSCEELSVVVYDLKDNLRTEFSNLREQSATRAVVEADTRLQVKRLEDKVKELVDTVDKIEKTTSQIPSIFEKLEVILDRTSGNPVPMVSTQA